MAGAEKDVDLYNPHEGLTGRDGGPYLDLEEAKAAETRRAQVEGRKPDYSKPGSSAGIPLVTAPALVNASERLNVPSRDGTEVQNDALRHLTNTDAVSASAVASIPVAALNKETKVTKDNADLPQHDSTATNVDTTKGKDHGRPFDGNPPAGTPNQP